MTEINTAEDAKAGEAGGSSSHPNVDTDHFDPDRDNLIDTVEIDDDLGSMDLSTGGSRQEPDAKPVEEKDASEKDGKTETDKTDKVEDKTDDSETKKRDYHEDPAWQRIIRERDAALKENAELKLRQTPEDDGNKEFIDLSTKTEEEIAEWMNDDPAGFAENQRKAIKYEIMQDMKAEQREKETQSAIDKTFSEYSKRHPDNDDNTGFVQMWESGKIQEFMEKNPGHNAISAHIMLNEEHMSQSIEGRIKKGIEDGVARVKEKLLKENKARVRTDGLDSGPSYTPGDEDDELKDTKKKGGLISVLAARSARRKAQSG